ncbi:hypothetical protein [Janthinobacterium sp. MDT1-19]|uniref:hypothetical protein n=1 Tax=Janthinobacterium sp. MDT1-19 TaxID=1259339 RepID=UPI003F22EF52
MKKLSIDPFIITKKAVFMQRVSDLVGLGYDRYVFGQIPINKVGYFSAKLHLNYCAFDNKLTAHRQRKKGYASSRLLLYFPGGIQQCTWILLLTPGNWPTHHQGNEKWLNPTEKRIEFGGYELVRHIRAGNSESSWTWRYTSRQYDDLRDSIVLSIRRHHTQHLETLIDTIWRSPGFGGVREQVKKFSDLIKAEWTRTGVGDIPKIPKGMGYVRRLPDKGKLLSKLLKEVENGDC